MPRPRVAHITLPELRKPAALPTGPKLYRTPKGRGYQGPVTVPPPGFLNGNNSKYEWMVYKAISSVLGFPVDPRKPPFIGFPGLWSYQKAVDSGRHLPGGAVIDFVVYAGAGANPGDIAFRVQTEFFHIFTDSTKQAFDLLQLWRLSQFYRVVDLYDQDFAWDETNQATVKLIKRALAGETFSNPITSGTAERVDPERMIER